MPVPWKGRSEESFGIPLKVKETESISRFHFGLEERVRPIIDRLWKDDPDSHVAESGFFINQPFLTDQSWHRDGPEAGLINVFLPLIDLTLDIGPTAVWSNTHDRMMGRFQNATKDGAPAEERGITDDGLSHLSLGTGQSLRRW